MIHQHGNDIETLYKNMVHMFTDGQNKAYSAKFERNQKIDSLKGSVSGLTDLLYRV